jgi:hypothetical protein
VALWKRKDKTHKTNAVFPPVFLIKYSNTGLGFPLLLAQFSAVHDFGDVFAFHWGW